MNDRLSVAVRAVGVTACDQSLPQFAMVVDLAINDDLDDAILVADGLVARGKVDDAQSAHADTHRALRIDALIVRSPMGNDFAHSPQGDSFCPGVPAELENSSNSTHR